MQATERRAKLIDLIRRSGFSSLPDLAETLDVSESTVRRDLSHLEKEGSAKRTHGGVFYTGPTPHLSHFRHRQQANWNRKKAIAAVAAGLVEDGDTLILDGGSTTYEVARLLVNRPLQVVTNSLPIANLFSGSTNVDLVVLGGYVHNRSGAIHGGYTNKMLTSIRVRRALMGAAGIDQEGLFNSNAMLASTQREMLKTAEEVIVVADASKFGHQSLAHICTLEEINRLVVDDSLEANWQKTLTDADVDLVLATPTATNDAQTI